MKIKVIYPNRVDYVEPDELDDLIRAGRIMAFERQHKLVVLGIHPTRQKKSDVFQPERRRSAAKAE